MGGLVLSLYFVLVLSFFSVFLSVFLSIFSPILASPASPASGYPAVFKTRLGSISTVEQYKERVASKYPSLSHNFLEGETVVYKKLELKAMVFITEGVLYGDKHKQKLTYGEIIPGLWKLIFLEAEYCVPRRSIVPIVPTPIVNNTTTTAQNTSKAWICEESWLPIAGVFADVFLVDSADLELSILSEVLGMEVTTYTAHESEEEALMTIEELKALMLELGASWSEKAVVWRGFRGQGPDQKAISITVSGEANERIKFTQTFLYFYREDQMVLGSIDGEICEFVDRVDKFICEKVFVPTQYTPFPYMLALSASESESESGNASESESGSASESESGNASESESESGNASESESESGNASESESGSESGSESESGNGNGNGNVDEPPPSPQPSPPLSSPPPSEVEQKEDIKEREPLRLSCGFLDQNYSMLLQFHFERDLFEIYEIEGFRRALSNVVDVLDPENLLISKGDREIFERINQPPYLFSHQVDELAESIRLGRDGECGVLIDLTQRLFLNFQDNISKIQSFLSQSFLSRIEKKEAKSAAFLIDETDGIDEKYETETDGIDEKYETETDKIDEKYETETETDETDKTDDEYDSLLWSWTIDKASELGFFSTSKSVAIDIALGRLNRYVEEALNFSQDLELLMTASFFKEDAYSHLIKEQEFLFFTQSQNSQSQNSQSQNLQSQNSQSQNSRGLYFGVQMIKGLKGHYVYNVHPQTQRDYDLQPGDEVVSVNGHLALELSVKDMDRFWVDTSKPLVIDVRRKGKTSSKKLVASYLDLAQMSYTFTPTSHEKIFKLKLNSFPAGLVDGLVQILNPLVEQNKIKGLVIDLADSEGGDTEELRRFLSMFIKEGPLFYYKVGFRNSVTAPTALLPSSEYFVSSDLPLIVVSSDQTMSAAEIASASLKDHGRALLVGGRTFGKFVGQRIFPIILSNQKQVGLKTTVAEFFSPLGRALNGLGVKPHIKTLDSQPVFKDGNEQGTDMTHVEPLLTQHSFLSSLNLKALESEAQLLIQNNQVVNLAIKAIDQSQKNDANSFPNLSEVIR